MGNVIDLDLVREGDAHLKRAKRLNPNVTARPVPVEAIATGALTVTQLAQLAGVHPQTIRRAIAARELQAASKGRKGHHRISRTDAEAWWRRRGGGTLLGDATSADAYALQAPAYTNGNGAGNNGLAQRLTLLDSMTDDLPNDRAAAGLAPLTDDDIASSYDED
jgi:excisionase family DNA binding protein